MLLSTFIAKSGAAWPIVHRVLKLESSARIPTNDNKPNIPIYLLRMYEYQKRELKCSNGTLRYGLKAHYHNMYPFLRRQNNAYHSSYRIHKALTG
ncbi:hypothetical protein CDAR_255661 [Caerostris darwini]|uniref:Uncharacterized protein n=1 Tax=Caerostris darwini TaxID=1538125 RepID=A0AAV4VF34_9ARAC|nr:hypothetical protein CDAR_255661 [Caerostris darwini]